MRVIILNEGKYTIAHNNGALEFRRYDEKWPAGDDLCYSGVVLAMVQRIEELEDLLAAKN